MKQLKIWSTAFISFCTIASYGQSYTLEQVRNGRETAPDVDWVTGAANATLSHYVEGHSVPYRATITGLSGAQTGTVQTVTYGFDTTKGENHAFDYITSYQRLEPHTFPNHDLSETIDPLDGILSVPSNAVPSYFNIPVPSTTGTTVPGQPASSFSGLTAEERVMTMWGGTITGLAYVRQDALVDSDAETHFQISFIATNETVVFSWGGSTLRLNSTGGKMRQASLCQRPESVDPHTILTLWIRV